MLPVTRRIAAKTVRPLLLIAACGAVFAGCSTGNTDPSTVWVQQSETSLKVGPGANAEAYMTLESGNGDVVTGASVPATHAKGAQLVGPDGSAAQVTLVPSVPTQLQAGGYRVQITGLTRPMRSGDYIPVTLRLKDGNPVTVNAAVQ